MPKIEELVDRSKGKIRADVAHRKITAMGYRGSERSTRRAVAEVKAAWRAGRRRRYRPWVPEPGMWLQWDWGEGPRIGGRRTQLFCAWLAWSRFRVVIPAWDQQLGTLTWCLDQALRAAGGAPTYLLTDNPKTVTMDHVAGIPVRHPEMVAVGRHYGCAVETCVPFDPESKGGVEATVKIAAADLVPSQANLLPAYGSFAGLEEACREFCPGGPAGPAWHQGLRRAFTSGTGRPCWGHGRAAAARHAVVEPGQSQQARGLDVIGGQSIHRVTAAAFAAARPGIWPGGLTSGTDGLSRLRGDARAMSTAWMRTRPAGMRSSGSPGSWPPSAAEFRCVSLTIHSHPKTSNPFPEFGGMFMVAN